MRCVLAAALCLPTAVMAWDRLDGEGVAAALTDRTLTYEGGIVQHFHGSGVTDYITTSLSQGRWSVRAGQYCSVWPPSDRWECYDVEVEGQQVRFVTSDGSASVGTYAE